MKSIAIAALALLSTTTFAAEIVPARRVVSVRVDSIQTTIVGQGFPSTEVKVQATFGNACSVPRASELVSIVGYADHFDTLVIGLGYESNRVCTQEYAPVTVTINLGQQTRPNDGLFSKVVVNGVEKVLN